MSDKFPVVCIIGSMRFYDGMLRVAERETAAGRIVLMPFVTKGANIDADMLDDMHRQKMDMSQYIILVTDNALYTGVSTKGELAYADSCNKLVFTNIV